MRVCARAAGAVNTAPHKHGYVIRAARSRRARLFLLTIEVGPIATDGCDVTVHRQPHSAKSMKYLTALLIPHVVHESAPRRKFISREVRCWPEHASPRPTCSPTIIEFLRYIFASLYVHRCGGKYSRSGNVVLFVAIWSEMIINFRRRLHSLKMIVLEKHLKRQFLCSSLSLAWMCNDYFKSSALLSDLFNVFSTLPS